MPPDAATLTRVNVGVVIGSIVLLLCMMYDAVCTMSPMLVDLVGTAALFHGRPWVQSLTIYIFASADDL